MEGESIMSIYKRRKMISIFMIVLLGLSSFTAPMQTIAYAASEDQKGEDSNASADNNLIELEEPAEDDSESEKEKSTSLTEDKIVEESHDEMDEDNPYDEASSDTSDKNVTNEEEFKADEPSRGKEEDSITLPDLDVEEEVDSNLELEEEIEVFDPSLFEMELNATSKSNTITVTWEANQKVDAFELYLDGKGVEIPSDVNSYTFEGLSFGEWYEIELRAIIGEEFIFYEYVYEEIIWSEEDLVPVSFIFMFNEDATYDEYLRIRGLDEENESFTYNDWLYGNEEGLLLPPGKLEVLIYDSYDYSIQAAHEIMIEEGKDYINNPIQLQFRLKEMLEAAEPFEYEVADVTENSFTLRWNEVSKITGFEIFAYGQETYHNVESKPIEKNTKEYTLTGLNPNLTYYINFHVKYVNDLINNHSFNLKTVGQDAEAPIVSFDNDLLQQAVAEELGIHLRDVTEMDIKKLDYLSISSNEVDSLEGLQFAENLYHLYGYNNNISDITALQGLRNLESLSLEHNNISDITVLENLVNLETLDLYNNEITNIEVLQNLINLKSINLDWNHISDINSLSALTQLNDLLLNDNEITNIDALSNLTKLKNLYLDSNKLDQITAIENLVELEQLGLGSNEINVIDSLAKLAELNWLYLDNNRIEDISALSALNKLETLSLYNNYITDISPLAELRNLDSIDLSWNEITDIEALASLTSLRDLQLSGNNISDISSLKNLSNLEYLSLSYNEFTDITVLKELPYLQTVYLYGNDITDKETIQYLRNSGVEVYYDEEDGDWNDWEDEDWNGEVDMEEVLQAFPKEQGFIVSEDGRNISLDLSNAASDEQIELTPEQTRVLIENRQNIEVKKDGVETTIPSSAFDNYEESVTINVVEKDSVPNSLSSTYDFTIKQGTRNISTFDEGVTLTFNVNGDRAKNPNNLKVFYFNEETKEWERVGGTYSNGKVSVVTYHFSTFTVFEVEDEETTGEETPETEENLTPEKEATENVEDVIQDKETTGDKTSEKEADVILEKVSEGDNIIQEEQSDSEDNNVSSEHENLGSVAVESNNNTHEEKTAEEQTAAEDSNRLPNTASPMFNIMLAGVLLFATGIIIYLKNRRRQDI